MNRTAAWLLAIIAVGLLLWAGVMAAVIHIVNAVQQVFP